MPIVSVTHYGTLWYVYVSCREIGSDLDIPAAARIIDAKGKLIIPGMNSITACGLLVSHVLQ